MDKNSATNDDDDCVGKYNQNMLNTNRFNYY